MVPSPYVLAAREARDGAGPVRRRSDTDGVADEWADGGCRLCLRGAGCFAGYVAGLPGPTWAATGACR